MVKRMHLEVRWKFFLVCVVQITSELFRFCFYLGTNTLENVEILFM